MQFELYSIKGGKARGNIRIRPKNAPDQAPQANFKEESGNLTNIAKIGFIRENGI